MPTVINDKMFASGCDKWEGPHLTQLAKLVQQPGQDPQSVLRSLGWDGQGPVVAMTTTIDCETRKVTRSDYFTAGLLFQFTGPARGFGGYKPPGARKKGKNVKLSFAVRGEMLQWGCEAGKNVTRWYELRELDAGVQFTGGKEGAILSPAQLRQLGVEMDEWTGQARVRFTLQHGGVGTMHISCSVLHTGSVVMPGWADLTRKPESVPGLVLKPKGKEVRHAVLPWIPLEEPGQKIGLCRLPVLVLPAGVQDITLENFPDREELGRAVAGHLRASTAVSHAKDEQDLLAWLSLPEPKQANQAVKLTWPEDRPRVDQSG